MNESRQCVPIAGIEAFVLHNFFTAETGE